MAGNLIASFAAPGVAALAVGVSAIFGIGGATSGLEPAYDGAMTRYEIDAARLHAEAVFHRADLDDNGALDSDEYASLAVVIAELSRFNGFVAYETPAGVETVALPTEAAGPLTSSERIRIDAVARAEFYSIAGDDDLIDEGEFIGEKIERFNAADRSRDGELTGAELRMLAGFDARLSARGV